MRLRWIAQLGTFITLTAAVGGCAAPPDVSLFAAATRDLADAVHAAGEETSQLLAEEHDTTAHALDEAWHTRDAAMRALVDYADNLNAIAQGRTDLSTFGESLKQLAIATGLITPAGSAAADIVTDAATLAFTQIDRMKAVRSLAEALNAAQPVVDAIAHRLGEHSDIEDLLTILAGLDSNIETAKLAATQPTNDYIQELEARRAALLPDGNAGDDVAILESIDLTQSIALARATLQALSAPFDRRAERTASARALVLALGQGLNAWANSHARLTHALVTHHPVDLNSLTEATNEIKSLIERIREQ